LCLIVAEEGVEFRAKPDNNTHVTLNERSSKPAIPERPPGLIRPSSLIRQQSRSTNENSEADPGVSKDDLTQLEFHLYIYMIIICKCSYYEWTTNNTTWILHFEIT